MPRTVSRKHADELNRKIHDLREEAVRATERNEGAEQQLRALRAELDRESRRSAKLLDLLATAHDGLGATARAAHGGADSRMTSRTLFSLERDGRAELLKLANHHANGHGQHLN